MGFFFNCSDECIHMCKTVSLLLDLKNLETPVDETPELSHGSGGQGRGSWMGVHHLADPACSSSESALYFWLFFL